MHLKYNERAAVKDMPHKDLLKEEINDLGFASCCSQATMNPQCLSPNHQLRDKLQLAIRLLAWACYSQGSADRSLTSDSTAVQEDCAQAWGGGRQPHLVLVGSPSPISRQS